ncbi:MAG: hypothetical protein V7K38_24090 [Nostoc sp.]
MRCAVSDRTGFDQGQRTIGNHWRLPVLVSASLLYLFLADAWA